MKRFFIGSLAVVGGVTLLFVAAIVGLAYLAASHQPGVPDSVVVELDISEPLREHVPEPR
ncbi:hypothetical protein ACN28S_56640 [Cystobacter fuscus]